MSEIRTSDWSEFAAAVAGAQKAGADVEIRTGPEADGALLALVGGGPVAGLDDYLDDDDDDDDDFGEDGLDDELVDDDEDDEN